MVVDEYGSLDGIITLHDIIENLVGSIPNENETPEPDVYVRKDKTVLINGEAPIEVLTQFIDDFIIDFEEIDYSTVAGFVLSHINKTPEVGDIFEYENLTFEIVDIDGNQKTLEGTGLMARAICHEIDHLEGILYIDKMIEEIELVEEEVEEEENEE